MSNPTPAPAAPRVAKGKRLPRHAVDVSYVMFKKDNEFYVMIPALAAMAVNGIVRDGNTVAMGDGAGSTIAGEKYRAYKKTGNFRDKNTALQKATLKVKDLDTFDADAITDFVTKEMDATLTGLNRSGIVLPPLLAADWLETFVAKAEVKIGAIDPDVEGTNQPDAADYEVDSIKVYINEYKGSWLERNAEMIANGLGFLVCLGTMANLFFEGSAFMLTATMTAGLPYVALVGFAYFWYTSGDFVDRVKKVATDLTRWWHGDYPKALGNLTLWRALGASVTWGLAGAVGFREAMGAFGGTFEAIISLGNRFKNALPLMLPLTTIAGGIAFASATFVLVGTMITLGYSLSEWFGFSWRDDLTIDLGACVAGHDGHSSFEKAATDTYTPARDNVRALSFAPAGSAVPATVQEEAQRKFGVTAQV